MRRPLILSWRRGYGGSRLGVLWDSNDLSVKRAINNEEQAARENQMGSRSFILTVNTTKCFHFWVKNTGYQFTLNKSVFYLEDAWAWCYRIILMRMRITRILGSILTISTTPTQKINVHRQVPTNKRKGIGQGNYHLGAQRADFIYGNRLFKVGNEKVYGFEYR